MTTKAAARKKTAPAKAPVKPEAKTRQGTVELTADQHKIVKQLAKARAALKAMKALEDDAKNQLKEILGDKHLGTVKGVPVVRAGDRTWTGNDSKVLKEAFPEAFEASYVESPYVVIDTL